MSGIADTDIRVWYQISLVDSVLRHTFSPHPNLYIISLQYQTNQGVLIPIGKGRIGIDGYSSCGFHFPSPLPNLLIRSLLYIIYPRGNDADWTGRVGITGNWVVCCDIPFSLTIKYYHYNIQLCESPCASMTTK